MPSTSAVSRLSGYVDTSELNNHAHRRRWQRSAERCSDSSTAVYERHTAIEDRTDRSFTQASLRDLRRRRYWRCNQRCSKARLWRRSVEDETRRYILARRSVRTKDVNRGSRFYGGRTRITFVGSYSERLLFLHHQKTSRALHLQRFCPLRSRGHVQWHDGN
jgi:hypothetical protein